MKNTRKRRSNSEFINDCNITHHSFYDYQKTNYKKLHDYITIICPIHGEFTQEANHHLRGSGCPKCGFERNIKLQSDTTKNFIIKAKSLHGSKYNYSKTTYGKNAHEKVILICKEHGEFKITPNSHLSKKAGCRKCGQLNTGWSKTTWKNACNVPGNSAKLYIIRCFNENESFYKIGITCKDLKTRLGHRSQLPYNYEIIKVIESKDSDYIFSLERKLHKQNKQFKYKPQIYFDGYTECFINYLKF